MRDRLLRGIRFLAEQQAPDGSFATQVAPEADMQGASEVQSAYIHSYVLQSLAVIDRSVPLVDDVVGAACAHLRAARQASGWWRFFGPDEELPPDDADDTSVAFAALLSAGAHDPELAQEASAWLAGLDRIRSESGLYKTWSSAEWNVGSFELPDVLVNANILFLQSIVGGPDGRVAEYLAHVVRSGTYHLLNLFAVSELALPYVISRCHQQANVPAVGASMDQLTRDVFARRTPDGGWGGALDTALALLTIVNAGHVGPFVRNVLEHLLDRQAEDGGFETGAFFRDLRPRYYGSRSLTTALCLEALCRVASA